MKEPRENQLERQALRRHYPVLFDEVSSILFRHDPIGINFETNTDEYEPEVGTILPRLKEAHHPMAGGNLESVSNIKRNKTMK